VSSADATLRFPAPRINPSILSADFVNLQDELARIESADLVHVDVMDNHFVPNLTIGPPVVQRIVETSPVPLDVHLMIADADRWAPQYAELGAFSVTFHAEAADDPVQLARALRARGSRAGIAFKPGTQIDDFCELLSEFDQVLVMTVEPGFGGQQFMSDMMPKLARLREQRDARHLDVWLQVDGGITEETIVTAAQSGADTFVAGSAVFRGDPAENIAALRAAATHAMHGH